MGICKPYLFTRVLFVVSEKKATTGITPIVFESITCLSSHYRKRLVVFATAASRLRERRGTTKSDFNSCRYSKELVHHVNRCIDVIFKAVKRGVSDVTGFFWKLHNPDDPGTMGSLDPEYGPFLQWSVRSAKRADSEDRHAGLCPAPRPLQRLLRQVQSRRDDAAGHVDSSHRRLGLIAWTGRRAVETAASGTPSSGRWWTVTVGRSVQTR
jgi:hypothetical protein